ncbi:MAG: hypothetical protein AB1705_26710, partial [Verrucomicrobiota bacterium]
MDAGRNYDQNQIHRKGSVYQFPPQKTSLSAVNFQLQYGQANVYKSHGLKKIAAIITAGLCFGGLYPAAAYVKPGGAYSPC